jgi:copper(I)-binding protein
MRISLAAACAVLVAALPALADDGISIENAQVRAIGASAKTAAAYFDIVNHGEAADRLVSVTTAAAAHAELHSSGTDAMGMMQMMPLPEGIAVAAGETHALTPGGEHVMLTGLTAPLTDGEQVTLTLTFEHAGAIIVEAPVATSAAPQGGMAMPGMSGMSGMTGH